eukprot:TRINITY_DN1029_c0_g1_i1.p1 TRINITY_DN1029_c0_g1~~TRINITY_DN1029_c0_g1_i1.p1  ORF type:complete len:487 (+),score=88.13 TRINITY_DN1029_c0_g1_i1:1036-2496(+)
MNSIVSLCVVLVLLFTSNNAVFCEEVDLDLDDFINPNNHASLKGKKAVPPYVLIWSGPAFSNTGYGVECRAFIIALHELGVPIKVIPAEDQSQWSNGLIPDKERDIILSLVTDPSKFKTSDPPRILVSHTEPQVLQTFSWARINIARTMWEMQNLSPNTIPVLSRFDDVWVPSNFNRDSFISAGIHKDKVVVIEECIEEVYINPNRSAPPVVFGNARKFSFLSVFTWQYRKGWDILVRAFVEEFSDEEDVSLIIKTSGILGKTENQISQELQNFIQRNDLYPNKPYTVPPNVILVVNAPITQNAMPNMYNAVQAFVLPTRAEGWGRPTFEAMAMGLPTITTKYSGQAEFVNKETAFPIPHKIVSVSQEAANEYPPFKGGKWAEPSVTHLKKIMRKVVNNYEQAKQVGDNGMIFILENFRPGEKNERKDRRTSNKNAIKCIIIIFKKKKGKNSRKKKKTFPFKQLFLKKKEKEKKKKKEHNNFDSDG